jgi:hypothetical protein
MKNDERLSGEPARPGAQPEFGQSTIDRAVEHVYRTVSPEILTSGTTQSIDSIQAGFV